MPTPDLQPTLIGPRMIVRPIAPTDWDEMFAAAADPKVWALHPVPERYKAEVFREFFDGALKSEAAFSFVDRPKRSSARAATTATTRRSAKSRSAGRSSRAPIGAAASTPKSNA
jgi:RimJ/RimL family protein N-acetyltransferase